MCRVFEMTPIGRVAAGRAQPDDDFWGGSESRIELADEMPTEALDGIEDFSHVEIVFIFDRVAPTRIVLGARHPRNNADWPLVGILAQRGKDRPNRIGCTIVRVVAREGRSLIVSELDAVEGTRCSTSNRCSQSTCREPRSRSPSGLTRSCATTGQQRKR